MAKTKKSNKRFFKDLNEEIKSAEKFYKKLKNKRRKKQKSSKNIVSSKSNTISYTFEKSESPDLSSPLARFFYYKKHLPVGMLFNDFKRKLKNDELKNRR